MQQARRPGQRLWLEARGLCRRRSRGFGCRIRRKSGDGGELLGFAAEAVQNPDLSSLRLAWASGEERDVFAVGREGSAGGSIFAEGELNGRGAVPVLHPEVGVVLIFLRILAGDGIEDPGTIGRDGRSTDAGDFGQIVQRDGALGRRSLCGSSDDGKNESGGYERREAG